MKNRQRGFAWVPVLVAVVIVAAVVGWGYYSSDIDKYRANRPGQTGCTEEGKMCPDGSYVGRTGPNCEFAACPSTRQYISRSVSVCAAIKYICTDGKKRFSDSSGCGCESVEQ